MLKVRPVAELDAGNRIKVHVPAFEEKNGLQRPNYSSGCILRLMLVAVNFRENYYEYCSYKDIDLGMGPRFAGHDWQPEERMPEGSIVMLSVSLHYFGASGMLKQPIGLNSREFSPAEILAAFHIPVGETMEPEQGQATEATVDEEMKRFPLSNYLGAELKRRVQKMKEQHEKKHGKPVAKQPAAAPRNIFELPKGRIVFKKE